MVDILRHSIPYRPPKALFELVQRLPAPRPHCGFITCVGSRKTPSNVLNQFYLMAAILYSFGFTIRSGGANGADAAFEQGVLDHPYSAKVNRPPMEIYLPWDGFNGKRHDPDKGYYDASRLSFYDEATKIAEELHPLGEALRGKQGVHKLHTRNIFQVLGLDLHMPSRQLWCWAPTTSDGLVEGGTRTAVACALTPLDGVAVHAIPIRNVYVANYHTHMECYIDGSLRKLLSP